MIGIMGLFFAAYVDRWLALQTPTDTRWRVGWLATRQGLADTLVTHWQLALVRVTSGLVVMGWVGYVAGFGMKLVYTFLFGLIVALILHIVAIYSQSDEASETRLTYLLIASVTVNAIALVAFTLLFISLQATEQPLSVVPRLMLGYCFGLVVGHGKSSSFNWISITTTALVCAMLFATQHTRPLPFMTFPLFVFSTGFLLSLGVLNWGRATGSTGEIRLRVSIISGYGLLIGLVVFSAILFFGGGELGTLGAMLSGVIGGGLLVLSQQVITDAVDDSSLKLSDNFLVTGLIVLGMLWLSLSLDSAYGVAVALVGLLSTLLMLWIQDNAVLNSLSPLQICATALNALALSWAFLHVSGLSSSQGLLLSMDGLSRLLLGLVMGGVFVGWMIIHLVKHSIFNDEISSTKLDGWLIQSELIWVAFPSILTMLIALGVGNILGEIVGQETLFGAVLGISLVGWIMLMAINLPMLPRQMVMKLLQWIPLLAVILSFALH